MLSVDDARRWYADLLAWRSGYEALCANSCAVTSHCARCTAYHLTVDAASIASDMAVAFAIHGRGTPTATRMAAVDAAREAGVAWA